MVETAVRSYSEGCDLLRQLRRAWGGVAERSQTRELEYGRQERVTKSLQLGFEPCGKLLA